MGDIGMKRIMLKTYLWIVSLAILSIFLVGCSKCDNTESVLYTEGVINSIEKNDDYNVEMDLLNEDVFDDLSQINEMEENITIKEEQEMMWETYSQIAEEYAIAQEKEMAKEAWRTGERIPLLEKEYDSMFMNLLYFSNIGQQEFLVQDINEDGIPEFMIARYFPETREHIIYDAFTWKDEQLYQLVTEYIGERSGTFDIQDGGYILSRWSGNMYLYGVRVYVLPENSTSLQLKEEVYALDVQNGMDYQSEFYHCVSPGEEIKITEEEYNEYLKQYQLAQCNYITNSIENRAVLKEGKIY